MRILLIEDDPMIGAGLERALRDQAMSVDWVRDGEDGEAALAGGDYALVLLDLGQPPYPVPRCVRAHRQSDATTCDLATPGICAQQQAVSARRPPGAPDAAPEAPLSDPCRL